MATTYGTSHFVSLQAAIKYYKQYGYSDVKAAVERKLREGEIHLGPPTIPSGHKAVPDEDGRYIMEQV